MKNILKIIWLTLVLGVCVITGTFAQQPAGQNYWVVETNLKQRDYSIVRFYNRHNELIYEEKLNNIYLNISRPRHVKKLNLALGQVAGKQFAAVSSQKIVSGYYRR
ncbi:hypothetical protein AAE02nite_33190 [Adhaeribacter aerolatus]|uniref:Uncharacterized protein n=1 Tax=Adhaeribacter aerolatus TaxID=670289 RepID=A0A512B118_9BACT|nr:hypothetical protein [Adhaeribacter aerolatus]GEO05655.1 hypothetical protein AAE02nite_33190 [Adhaeribacter aerolatus]